MQAYDSHCNLVLGDVEETIFVAEEEEDDQEPRVRTVKKQSEMLFVRGMSFDVKRGCWKAILMCPRRLCSTDRAS